MAESVLAKLVSMSRHENMADHHREAVAAGGYRRWRRQSG